MTYQLTTIVGNLGGDPELKYTQSGVPFCSFSVATSKKWTDADGTKREKTTWFRVTAWNALAEACNQYLAKGRQVMVTSDDVEASAYITRDNEPAASLNLRARDVRFLSGNGGGERAEDGTYSDADIPF